MSIIINLDVMLAKRKMQLQDLAQAVGITAQNLSILKTGKAKAIRFSTLEAICQHLDCQPGDILEFRKETQPIMNKLFVVIFFTLFHQVNLLVSSDCIDEFRARLKIEQVKFLSNDIHDVQSIKTMISTMYKLDQEFRTIYIHDRNNHDVQTLMLEIDQFHTQKMKDIITSNGWLTIDKFDKETDHQAWLLVQHSMDLIFQKNCLQLLDQAMKTKQTSPINYAYLYDRVTLQLKEYDYKQKYGTQFHVTDKGELVLQAHEGTMENIDKHRLLIGLCSFEEYSAQLQKLYTK